MTDFVSDFDIAPGDFVTSNGTIPCMNPNKAYVVHSTQLGEYYVHCCAGRHYLDGQYDHNTGVYLGVVLKTLGPNVEIVK